MGLFISLIALKTLLCSCIFQTDEKSVRDKIRQADMIIYAKALPTTGSKINRDSTVFVEQVDFEIKSVFKGQAIGKIRLKNSGQSCDASFRVGENYIVFAFKDSQSGEFATGGCQSVSEWTKNDLKEPRNSLKEERRFFKFVKDLIAREVK